VAKFILATNVHTICDKTSFITIMLVISDKILIRHRKHLEWQIEW